MKFDDKYYEPSLADHWDVIKENIMQRDKHLVEYMNESVLNIKQSASINLPMKAKAFLSPKQVP